MNTFRRHPELVSGFIKTFLLSLGLLTGLQAGRSDTAITLANRVQTVLGQTITVKMPPKLQTLFFKTLLAVTKGGDVNAEKVFLQQHLPLLTGMVTKQYKQLLQEQKSQYAAVIGRQEPRVQRLLARLHTQINQVPTSWLTWKKAAVIGVLTALAIGGGVMWHNRQQKRDNAARIIQRFMARNKRERDIQAAMILERQELLSEEEKANGALPASPFYLERDVAETMRTVAQQIANGDLVQHGFDQRGNDVIPGSWDGKNGIYRTGDVMIKTHRWPGRRERHLPMQNVRRALGAFRVNNVAPTIHALRVDRGEVPSVGDDAIEEMPIPNQKKGKTVVGRMRVPQLKDGEWRTHAIATRLAPLPGTITPAQAKKNGTRPSPIDDRHYVVLEKAVPVDHADRRQFYRGGRPSNLGEAVAQQIVTAAHLAGTDDLHASNVIPTNTTDKESDVTLIDLEQHSGINRGERPSKKEVVKSLLELLFYGQQTGLRRAFERMDNNASQADIEQKIREDRIAYGKNRLLYYKKIKQNVREQFFNDQVDNNDVYKALRGKGRNEFRDHFKYVAAVPDDDSLKGDDSSWKREGVIEAFSRLLEELPALYEREDLVDSPARQEVLRRWRAYENMTDDDYLAFAHTPAA